MAAGTRTLKLKMDGDVRGVKRAAAAGSVAVTAMARQVSRASAFMAASMARVRAGALLMAAGIRKAAKGVGLALLATGVIAVGLGKQFIEAGREGLAVERKLNQVFTAMGGKGSNAFAALAEQSARLGKALAQPQTEIQKIQTKLGTFKNIWKDPIRGAQNFERATKLAFDLAAAGFGVADSNATQLGKALADPVKGMSALARSGVTFTEAEKDKIKALQESGDLLGAQEKIYKALENQVGGTAEAGVDAADRLKARWEDFQDSMGRKLIPVWDRLMVLGIKFFDWLDSTGIPALKAFGGWIKTHITPRLADLGGEIKRRLGPAIVSAAGWVRDDLWPALKTAWEWITGTGIPKLRELATTITDKLEGPLRSARDLIKNHVQPILDKFGGILAKHIKPAIENAKAALKDLNVNLNQFKPILKAVGALLLAQVATALVVVGAVLYGVALALRAMSNVLRHVVVPAWNAITGSARSAGAWIKGTAERVAGYVKAMASSIKRFTRGLWDGIRSGLAGAVNWVIDKINSLIDRINAIPGVSLARIPRISAGRTRPTGTAGLEARASGGPVLAGRSYLVGERGPELLTMGARAAGHITPNHELSGGPQVLEMHFDFGDGVKKVVRHEIKQERRQLRRRVVQVRAA